MTRTKKNSAEPGPVEPRAEVRSLRWIGGGRCLVEDQRGHTFSAAGAMPGELVDVTPIHDGHQHRWHVTKVHEAHPERRQPSCRHAATCTGCNLLHTSPAAELELKRLICAEVLERYAGVAWPRQDVEVIGDAQRGDHRHRSSMRLSRQGGALMLGLRDRAGAGNHVPDCPALVPELRQVYAAALEVIAPLEGLPTRPLTLEAHAGVRSESASGVPGGCGIVVCAADAERVGEAEVIAAALAESLDVAVAIRRERRGKSEVLKGPWPRPRMALTGSAAAGGAAADPDAWTQPTPQVAAQLHEWALAALPLAGRRVLDATAGLGELSIKMARGGAASVTAVERHWGSVESLASNAAGLNVEARGGDIRTVAGRLLNREKAHFDIVVINPMRRSLGDQTMLTLAQLCSEALLYLAPAPRAGAADLAPLIASGWRLKRVATANLHPGTAATLMAALLLPPLCPPA